MVVVVVVVVVLVLVLTRVCAPLEDLKETKIAELENDAAGPEFLGVTTKIIRLDFSDYSDYSVYINYYKLKLILL